MKLFPDCEEYEIYTCYESEYKHFEMPSFVVRSKIKFLSRDINSYSKCGLHEMKRS